MARPTGSCPPGRKPLLSDRETALGRRSFRPSPCRGRHPSSPRRRGGSNIHSYFWPMWLKYSFPLVAQILVPTWLKYSLTFTIECSSCRKKPLSKDEVGVCKKMLGKGTKKFFCLDCFASYLDTTVEELNEKIEEFKEEGCKLFS